MNPPRLSLAFSLLMVTNAATAAEGDFTIATFEKTCTSRWNAGSAGVGFAREGKVSLKWYNVGRASSLMCASAPRDWSGYQALSFWMHSKTANGQGIQLVLPSENPQTEGTDYYGTEIIVDWTGWKQFNIALSRLKPNRSPLGWNQIQNITFAAAGWNHKPLLDTVLHLDEVKLLKDATGAALAPESLRNSALVDKDGDGVPDGWRLMPAPQGETVAFSLTAAPDGNIIKLKDADAKLAVGVGQQVFAVPGHKYTLTAQMRGGKLLRYLRFLDVQRKLIAPEVAAPASGSADWKEETLSAVAPPETAIVEVWFYTSSVAQVEGEFRLPQLTSQAPAVQVPEAAN